MAFRHRHVPDDELFRAVHDIIDRNDPETLRVSMIMLALAERFPNTDLTHRRKAIKKEAGRYMDEVYNPWHGAPPGGQHVAPTHGGHIHRPPHRVRASGRLPHWRSVAARDATLVTEYC